MPTRSAINLVHDLLSSHFGPIVASVGRVLARSGSLPLAHVAVNASLTPALVKQALLVLIHHNFVEVAVNVRGFKEYTLNTDKVLCIVRFPRYIYIAKLL